MQMEHDKNDDPTAAESLPDGSGTDSEPSQQDHHDAETEQDTASGGPADG